MPEHTARCPGCCRTYPRDTPACPVCGLALQPGPVRVPEPPATVVFESWDRASVDIVVSLLGAHGLGCLVRGTAGDQPFGVGPAGFWRVFVRASDEFRAQEILDAEIGRDEES